MHAEAPCLRAVACWSGELKLVVVFQAAVFCAVELCHITWWLLLREAGMVCARGVS